DPWGGLELAGRVTFKDLVFEIDAAEAPKTLLAAVLLKGAGKVSFVGCTFRQPAVKMKALLNQPALVPVASVAVWGRGEGAEEAGGVELQKCYFERGQAAVSVLGNARVTVTSCAFGPHLSLFHLRGGESGKLDARLLLENVSAFLVAGPAFRLDSTAAVWDI